MSTTLRTSRLPKPNGNASAVVEFRDVTYRYTHKCTCGHIYGSPGPLAIFAVLDWADAAVTFIVMLACILGAGGALWWLLRRSRR